MIPPSALAGRCESWLNEFRDAAGKETPPSAGAYSNLIRYFLEGFLRYRLPHGTGANYPGLRSNAGLICDRMEGFTRTAPLWAAWLASGRPARMAREGHDDADLAAIIRQGLLAGTDPSSPEYWGAMRPRDQRIVEAGDLALILWLSRDAVWGDLPAAARERIAAWLRPAERLEVWNNNWHAFPLLVSVVLHRLGMPADLASAREHYAALKRFHLGGGWFSDGWGKGKTPKVDYYNVWGFHYPLWWLREIDPDWDGEFLRGAHEQFLATYKYFLGPQGFPVMGRSACYRMAVPAPLVLAQKDGSAEVSPGLARRALDATWTYFIAKGGVRDGNITQGYCASADPRVLDNYSGPASCLWGLRSLIAAFYLPEDHPFWTAGPEPLPVERGDFTIQIPEIGWTLVGEGGHRIEIRKPGRAGHIPLIDYGWVGRMAERILGRSVRPWNTAAKYDARVYSSHKPFTGCS